MVPPRLLIHISIMLPTTPVAVQCPNISVKRHLKAHLTAWQCNPNCAGRSFHRDPAYWPLKASKHNFQHHVWFPLHTFKAKHTEQWSGFMARIGAAAWSPQTAAQQCSSIFWHHHLLPVQLTWSYMDHNLVGTVVMAISYYDQLWTLLILCPRARSVDCCLQDYLPAHASPQPRPQSP